MDPSEERTRSLAWVDGAGDTPRLLVFWEGGFAARALGPSGSLVVGRALDCAVHVVHPSVSRRHVAVHAGPPLEVEDLGSHNGTRLNGVPLAPHARVRLEPGAVVEAGSAVVMVHAPAPKAGPTAAKSAGEPEKPMELVRRLVELVAVSGISVILLGETGVGKDVAACAIHARSPRAGGPFVRLNCAALPETLLESELFGHERGAFTGAVKSKPGLLETGNGGTVFLDEMAEMPLSTQAKLLRVLESREVLRVGGLEPRRIDVRFVAATNRDLPHLVAAGAFRNDLYYRLNGITIRIPPLRARREEIGPLVRAFVAEACGRAGGAKVAIDDSVLTQLLRHPWPGNIRELRNVVERAVVLCGGKTLRAEHIVLDALGRKEAPPSAARDLRSDVDEYERGRVIDALDRAGGNQTRAAELLGISRRALVGRIAAYGLPRPRKDRAR